MPVLYADWRLRPIFTPKAIRLWWSLPVHERIRLPLGLCILAAIAVGADAWLAVLLAASYLIVWAARQEGAFALYLPDQWLPLGPGQFPATVTLAYKDVDYAKDDGVVSIVDGWLHFEGTSTIFSIRPRDVANPRMLAASTVGFGLTNGVRMSLRFYKGIRNDDQVERVLVDDAATTVWNWIWREGGMGQSLFPPTVPKPNGLLDLPFRRTLAGFLGLSLLCFLVSLTIASTVYAGLFQFYVWLFAIGALGAQYLRARTRFVLRSLQQQPNEPEKEGSVVPVDLGQA